MTTEPGMEASIWEAGGDEVAALVGARHGDPFGLLGLHETAAGLVLRAFVPGAATLEAVPDDGAPAFALGLRDPAGFFEGLVPAAGRFGSGPGSRAPDRFRRGALGIRVTTRSLHIGHSTSPRPFWSRKSSSEANQPSKPWPFAQRRSSTFMRRLSGDSRRPAGAPGRRRGKRRAPRRPASRDQCSPG